MYNQMLNDKI
ncbi:hypothetical protein DWZ12_14505 [Blautia obeum]|uniref:Uncharacterized protein n=1 Tax=Blautia obeum TaxID=40520 RepID=A0A411ZIX2_9FIRM|nr:hypothetical protein DWZ12_14505 [Blautia obeum]